MSAYEFKLIVIDNEDGTRLEDDYSRYPTALTAFNIVVSVLRVFSDHKITVRLVDTTFDFVLNEDSW